MAKTNIKTIEQHGTTQSIFEQIKELDENENEYWSARHLSKTLDYNEFRNFLPVIEKAQKACEGSGQAVDHHFVHFHEMVSIGFLDHMGSTELAANLFRATQAEEKLRRDNIQGKENANQTHYEVGQKVRKTIEELGGTMPKNLPTTESIKVIEKKMNPKRIDEKG